MEFKKILDNVNQYFEEKSKEGKSMDWRTNPMLEEQYSQLCSIFEPDSSFSLLDYGAGIGTFYDYLMQNAYKVRLYYGYDILDSMVQEGRKIHGEDANVIFTSTLTDCQEIDYICASNVFDMKLNANYKHWTKYILKCLHEIDDLSKIGFSLNFLSNKTALESMQEDLYYADPDFFVDYCKTHFSDNVELLNNASQDYFTLLIRKKEYD